MTVSNVTHPDSTVLARPPPPLSVETPRKLEADTPENFRLRFLNRLKELIPLARSRFSGVASAVQSRI